MRTESQNIRELETLRSAIYNLEHYKVWTGRSLMACAGIISSCFLLGEGMLVGSSLLDVSSALGPLRMPRDIDNG